jgi:hypothetical protein
MAVKPRRSAGLVTSLIPGVFGGNMDIRLLGPDTTIYFPVHCAGAGFSVGDGHALQGDGEVNGTAVETAMTGIFGQIRKAGLALQPGRRSGRSRTSFRSCLEDGRLECLGRARKGAGVKFIIEPYIRFQGQPGEQATMFFLDPTGNALEFKAFGDIEKQLFAS